MGHTALQLHTSISTALQVLRLYDHTSLNNELYVPMTLR